MKRLTTIGLLAAIAATFLGAPHYAAAAAAESVTISVDMHLTGQTSAEGTFTASGAITDSGAASQTFQVAADGSSVQGTKTLRGSKGNIVINFSGTVTPTDGGSKLQVTGTWQVESGTQAYSGLTGAGQISTTIAPAAGTLQANYTGDISMDAAAAGSPGMPRTGNGLLIPGALLTLATAAIAAGGLILAVRGPSGRSGREVSDGCR